VASPSKNKKRSARKGAKTAEEDEVHPIHRPAELSGESL
jgi:hypothetical protein